MPSFSRSGWKWLDGGHGFYGLRGAYLFRKAVFNPLSVLAAELVLFTVLIPRGLV